MGKQKQFYKIAALSMIVAGSAFLIFSVADILNPREACQDTLYAGGVLMAEPNHCIDPVFEIGWSSSNSFILIMLAICLLAFGGAIVGMITRLS